MTESGETNAGAAETMAKNDDEIPAGGEARIGRLRFRKKEMPGGLWLKCESCGSTIFRKEVEEKAHTCPSCGFHFTMPGRSRVQHTLDSGTWENSSRLSAMDRLEFGFGALRREDRSDGQGPGRTRR